jgi:hypothetical protein
MGPLLSNRSYHVNVTTTATLSDAQKLGQEVYHLITQGHKGAALIAAKRGWRDFPAEVLASTPKGDMTFERLTVILSAELGETAEPAAPVESAPAAAPVSAAPEFYRPASLDNPAVPVSAAPVAPVSAVPVSAAPAAVSTVLIERTATDGTIIRYDRTMPKLLPLIGQIGWKNAKRGFLYLGDRDTAPNMAAIDLTLATLHQAGVRSASSVTGAEPARPVSAPPAAPARRAAAPTRRQSARKASPVTVRQMSAPPVSAAPVSPAAPVAPVFQAPAPVSAPPAAPAAPALDPAIAMMMEQMAAMQAQIAALAGLPAPAAPVAPVAPVSAVPVSPATLSIEETLASLIDTKKSEQLAKVESLTWQFRVAEGANVRHTAREMRQELAERVAGWWSHHHLGSVTFSVMVDRETPGVLHVKVNAAAGEITPTKLSEQVVGTILTVRGIKSRSTTKRDA